MIIIHINLLIIIHIIIHSFLILSDGGQIKADQQVHPRNINERQNIKNLFFILLHGTVHVIIKKTFSARDMLTLFHLAYFSNTDYEGVGHMALQ